MIMRPCCRVHRPVLDGHDGEVVYLIFQHLPLFVHACVHVCVFAQLTAVAQLPLLDVVADILRLAQNWLRSSTLHLEPLLVPLMQHANAQTRQVRVRACAR